MARKFWNIGGPSNIGSWPISMKFFWKISVLKKWNRRSLLRS